MPILKIIDIIIKHSFFIAVRKVVLPPLHLVVVNYNMTVQLFRLNHLHLLVVLQTTKLTLNTVHPSQTLLHTLATQLHLFESLQTLKTNHELSRIHTRYSNFLNIFNLNSVLTTISRLVLINVQHRFLQFQVDSLVMTTVELVSRQKTLRNHLYLLLLRRRRLDLLR